MKITVNDWNKRFLQQAGWTHHLRKYIYNRIGVAHYNEIIEVGCGTGAILNDFVRYKNKNIYGLDISEKFIRFAQQNNPKIKFILGDANNLPLENNRFDIALCHFFLLWVIEPKFILREMIRIVRNNGYLLILSEPDYGGRIDYPNDMKVLGDIQTKSLIKQGANPFIGRKLGSLFHKTGISMVELGILGGQWYGQQDVGNEDTEWQMLLYDLSFLGNNESDRLIGITELNRLREIHNKAQVDKTRIIFVPTFYALGQVIK